MQPSVTKKLALVFLGKFEFVEPEVVVGLVNFHLDHLGSFAKFEDDKTTWVKILRQNTQTTESIFDSLLQTTTGFLEIIGPDEQFFGYLVHEKMDLVALKVIDRSTMRIYYSPQRTEGK